MPRLNPDRIQDFHNFVTSALDRGIKLAAFLPKVEQKIKDIKAERALADQVYR